MTPKQKQGVQYTVQLKKPGSVGWLVIWIALFWPFAIVYYLMRSWGKDAQRAREAMT